MPRVGWRTVSADRRAGIVERVVTLGAERSQLAEAEELVAAPAISRLRGKKGAIRRPPSNVRGDAAAMLVLTAEPRRAGLDGEIQVVVQRRGHPSSPPCEAPREAHGHA